MWRPTNSETKEAFACFQSKVQQRQGKRHRRYGGRGLAKSTLPGMGSGVVLCLQMNYGKYFQISFGRVADFRHWIINEIRSRSSFLLSTNTPRTPHSMPEHQARTGFLRVSEHTVNFANHYYCEQTIRCHRLLLFLIRPHTHTGLDFFRSVKRWFPFLFLSVSLVRWNESRRRRKEK